MPVIQIRALPQSPGIDVGALMSLICVQVAQVLEVEPRRVWTTWETILPGSYVEGDVAAQTQPRTSHPPIVDIIDSDGRSSALIEKMILCVAKVLSTELEIDEGNVFIHFTEGLSGRVFSGHLFRK